MLSADAPPLPATTDDHLLGGRLAFEQPAEGYRAPVDGLLLAAFAGRATHDAVDLGAGAGMVTLALLAREGAPRVIAVERDAATAEILRRNLERNGFAARAAVHVGDVEALAQRRRGSAALVLANPPYYRTATATPARHPRAAAARSGDDPLGAFLRAARTLLRRGGRACFIWPAQDLETFLASCATVGLHAKRLRFVHPLPDRAAARVLAELKPGRPGGCVIEAPLLLQNRAGALTAEAARITGSAD